MRTSLLSSEQVLSTVTTWIVAALYGSDGVFPDMPRTSSQSERPGTFGPSSGARFF